MVLGKSDLVVRVMQLVDDEKRERERTRMANEDEEERIRQIIREQKEREERERLGRQEREDSDRREREAREREDDHSLFGQQEQKEGDDAADFPPRSTSPLSTSTSNPKQPFPERSSLCVICQDEEANIAIVDCGHLAMCKACSDLVMTSSRECPLCRTRIVTEARLLRIFKS